LIIVSFNRNQMCRTSLTPLASTPEQSRAARCVHTASIPWQSRCCSRPSTSTRWYRYVYSVSRFPATVTNTEQMPKTVLIPAVVLLA